VRPLDFLGSIKLKLGIVIVAAVALSVAAIWIGNRVGLSFLVGGIVAAALALALVQLLAHGMTFPLRDMVAAAQAMARGDYSRRVTATSRDEVGELARAFNSMAGELEEVDRLRRDLVANASHELRTPIGALRARLENIVDGVEEPSPAALEDALGQVERLGALVEQLLALSKLESGTVPLERETVPAGELLAQVAHEWSSRAQAKGVHLAVSTAPTDLELDVDVRRMHQVIANLLANAIRHSPPNADVQVRATTSNGHTRIEVADRGSGIPAEEAERVFERFYRSDRARTVDEGGAGLGLAIARWIVELHGGTIKADQSASPGCRMVVELPR
jgi:signal transduction histidine kinase